MLSKLQVIVKRVYTPCTVVGGIWHGLAWCRQPSIDVTGLLTSFAICIEQLGCLALHSSLQVCLVQQKCRGIQRVTGAACSALLEGRQHQPIAFTGKCQQRCEPAKGRCC